MTINTHYLKIIQYLSFLLICIPIILGGFFICLFSVNIPHLDQWTTDVPLALKFQSGNYSPNDFLQFFSDQRPTIPYLIMVTSHVLSQFNVIFEIFISYLIYNLSFLLLILIIQQLGFSRNFQCIILIPIAWYYFNFHLLSVITYAMSVFYSTYLCLTLATFYLFNRCSGLNWRYFLGIFAAFCCMFTFSAGIVIWFGCFLLIVLLNDQKRREQLIGLVISAIISFILYYRILEYKQSGLNGISAYINYLQGFIQYPIHKTMNILGTIGSNVIHEKYYAFLFGIAIIIIFLIVTILNKSTLDLRKTGILFALFGYFGLTSIMLTLARSGDNIYFGSASKIFYIPNTHHFPSTFLLLIIVYLLVIYYFYHNTISEVLAPKSYKSIFSCFLAGFMLALIIFGVLFHIPSGLYCGINSFNNQINNINKILNTESINNGDLEKIIILVDKENMKFGSKEDLDRISIVVDKGKSVIDSLRSNEVGPLSENSEAYINNTIFNKIRKISLSILNSHLQKGSGNNDMG